MSATLENIILVVKIGSLSGMKPEIKLLPVSATPSWFSLLQLEFPICNYSIVLATHENIGIAVGISFLSCIGPEL